MADQSSLSACLDIAAAILGFASSAALLVTAFRATPLQVLLDRADALKQGAGGGLATVAARRIEQELRDVRIMERPLLVLGAGLLMLSFACSILSKLT